MANKILVVVAGLVVICLALNEKKMAEACNRPRAFKNTEVLAEYINCVKSLAGDQRYGKRSYPSQSLLIKNLQPKMYMDYEPHNNRDLQELYDMLKYDEN
ncbi:hypothetical protein NQ317_000157 [Molorchus minor]|uniref:Uncharacterized protein n=1 Tax=Molorchus minor TaxID=1323400 RepID=A0ABQ9JFN6_9CUCU|nr:hypothetical protein NQ317_000157 [Molorchus minor]